MNMIQIIFNASLERSLMKILAALDIKAYTKFEDVLGVGNHSEPHLNSTIWPGINHSLMIALDQKSKEKLLKEIKALKQEHPKDGLKTFVFPLEEII